MKLSALRSAVLFFSEPLSGERPSAGGYDDHGRWVDLPSTSLEISGSIQPATMENLDRAEEGRRLDGRAVLFTLDELQSASVDGRVQPDVVFWKDKKWEVESVDKWDDVSGHYKVTLKRVGQ